MKIIEQKNMEPRNRKERKKAKKLNRGHVVVYKRRAVGFTSMFITGLRGKKKILAPPRSTLTVLAIHRSPSYLAVLQKCFNGVRIMGYLGSKAASGVYQKIIAEMPPHETYIETHLGGGAVMLRKPPAQRTWGVDIDTLTVEDFCQSNPIFIDALSDDLFIEVADAVLFLQQFDFASAGRVLVYADPPYLPSTRSGSARYRREYSVEDHVTLLACLRHLPESVSVILSGYPSELYDSLLLGWRTREFQAMTRGGVRTEKIWMNYPEGGAYSHTFAGKDYNDRYRIKRKAARWREKYAALPPAERLAIMVALSQVETEK